jgi:hypothetical protein
MMDEMMEALSSLASLTNLKDGVEPIQAVASSVGLSWKEISKKIGNKEFSFEEAKEIISNFGDALRVGNEQNDDQSEADEISEVKKPIIGVDFLQNALLKALGVNNESSN